MLPIKSAAPTLRKNSAVSSALSGAPEKRNVGMPKRFSNSSDAFFKSHGEITILRDADAISFMPLSVRKKFVYAKSGGV